MGKHSDGIHVDVVSKSGPIWFIGWLFTIGYADLSFWKGVLALLLWPFYLGQMLA